MKKAKKVVCIKDIWAVLWAEYKAEWKALWCEYKSLIIPFVEGTAKYIWQLVYGLIKLLTKGLYRSGKLLLEKLIAIIKKA
jgi:hypothetical protein